MAWNWLVSMSMHAYHGSWVCMDQVGSNEVYAFKVLCHMQMTKLVWRQMNQLYACFECTCQLTLGFGMGKMCPCRCRNSGFYSEVCVCIMLIGMYVKCGNNEDVFLIVSPNAMRRNGALAISLTWTSRMLRVPSSNPSALEWGREVPAHIMKLGLKMWCLCGNCIWVLLASMYAKCGVSEDAFNCNKKVWGWIRSLPTSA